MAGQDPPEQVQVLFVSPDRLSSRDPEPAGTGTRQSLACEEAWHSEIRREPGGRASVLRVRAWRP